MAGAPLTGHRFVDPRLDPAGAVPPVSPRWGATPAGFRSAVEPDDLDGGSVIRPRADAVAFPPSDGRSGRNLSGPTASQPSGTKARRGIKRHHPIRNTIFAILGALVLIVGGGAAYLYWNINSRLDTPDISGMLDSSRPPTHQGTAAVKTPGDPWAGQAVNILVMGTDSRAGANAGISGDDNEGARSDTTFIMHVSGDRTRIDLVSIPRDVLITIPKCLEPDGTTVIPEAGWSNMGFNAAFAYGSDHGDSNSGAACTIRAVEAMSNVRIDAFVVADFAGFAAIVDSVGGVDIDLPCPVSSPEAGNLNLPAGMNHLNGDEATNYMRARKGKGLGDGSDLQRIERQHQLLMNLVNKVLGLNYFTQFSELYNFVGATADAVTTNLGSNVAELAGFAYSLKNFHLSNMTFHMIPVADAGDGVHVVLAKGRDAPIWQALIDDTPLPEDGTTVTAPTDTNANGAAAGPIAPSSESSKQQCS